MKKSVFVIVVSVLFAFFSAQALAAPGCFTEPSFPDICTEIEPVDANAACSASSNPAQCLATFFFEGIACGNIAECTPQQGWCTDSCTFVDRQARCFDRNSFIAGVNQPPQCQEGCCICDNNFLDPADNVCEFSLTSVACSQKCSTLVGYQVGSFTVGGSLNACTNACLTFQPQVGTISGKVSDDSGVPLNGVTIDVQGVSTQTNAQGDFLLENIPAGNVILTATLQGFLKNTTLLILAPDQQQVTNIILVASGTGIIRGVVRAQDGSPLADVRVFAAGPTAAQAISAGDGSYELLNLPFGNYELNFIKAGFAQANGQAAVNIAPVLFDVTLEPAPQGVLRGVVRDGADVVPFATIIINSAPAGLSNSQGIYNVQLFADADGESYRVVASKAGFVSPEPVEVIIRTGETVSRDLTLAALALACPFPQTPPVVTFNTNHVPGEEAVLLTWTSPCKDAVAFVINRTEANREVTLGVVNGKDIQFKDTGVEWGKLYTYEISAVYSDVTLRTSAPRQATITLGNATCENKFAGPFPLEFCLGSIRQQCSPQNQVIGAPTTFFPEDCRSVNGFCMGPNAVGETICAQGDICTGGSVSSPFGLFSTKDQCLGAFNPFTRTFVNPCYFDSSTTVVDACFSCEQITSCFDYQSKDACETNSCRPKGQDCVFVFTAEEFGKGFCAPRNVEGTAHCSDCSPLGKLFKNAFCTAEICSLLGDCFPNQAANSCVACTGASTCSLYQDETSCTGGSPISVFQGQIQLSQDSCRLGRCTWDGTKCFKDGNVDGRDECVFDLPSGTNAAQCRSDNQPSSTTLTSGNVFVNVAGREITFSLTGNARKLFFCIDKPGSCLPDQEVNVVNGVARTTLGADDIVENVGEGIYKLRFFSLDAFLNRESLQQVNAFVDITPPQITLLNATINEKQGGSDVTVSSALSETVTCSDSFAALSGISPQTKINRQAGAAFQSLFTGVADGLYTYAINCTDAAGNSIVGRLELIEVDALRFVEVVAPKRAIKQTRFRFELKTSDDAACILLENGLVRENFVSTNGVSHTSSEFSFPTNSFHPEWSARCTDLATGQVDTVFIPFTIDELPPVTTIVLTGSDGRVERVDESGWTRRFATNVTVNFVCNSKPETGFACKPTNMCVSQSPCVPVPGVPPQLKESQVVCYSSEDEGGNAETVKCGTVLVDRGFGIRFIQPPFGVSNVPSFDVVIGMDVPSDTCKFVAHEFGSGEFDFNLIQNPRNLFQSLDTVRFLLSNFSTRVDGFPLPQSTFPISIKCNSTTGQISPPQILNVIFDPTPPSIRNAFADPSVVAQGDSVALIVETDDLTICKFGTGIFDTMNSKFPGFDENQFADRHTANIAVRSTDDGKAFNVSVQCRNRAGNVSDVRDILYSVDFSLLGAIRETFPQGVLAQTAVTLGAITSKNAQCSFLDGQQLTPFTQTNGLNHTSQKPGLTEGQQTFPLRCRFIESGAVGEDAISFIIDLTPPVLRQVIDGNVTCALDSIAVRFDAIDNSSSVSSFNYKVFEKGTTVILVNDTAGNANQRITGLNLTEGREYVVSAVAIDAAGFISNEVTSDGVLASQRNATECLERGPPSVTIEQQALFNRVDVSLECVDETGCISLNVGTATSAQNCLANTPFGGVLSLEEPAFICFEASDAAGNIARGGVFIQVPDEDNDGVLDTFDKCPATPFGEIVNNDGCSLGQLRIDSDNDGLPDDFEIQFQRCGLDFQNRDSDGDGLPDADSDNDQDGASNRAEFEGNSDPCDPLSIPGLEDDDGDGVSNTNDRCPGTPVSERTTVIRDAQSLFLGCGPSQRDTDGDGMTDDFEQRNGFNPDDPADASLDADGDGLTNLEEFRRGTNPREADSDGDGFTDGEEIDEGTNPLDPFSLPERLSVIGIISMLLGMVLVIGGGVILYLYEQNKPVQSRGNQGFSAVQSSSQRRASSFDAVQQSVEMPSAPVLSTAQRRHLEAVQEQRRKLLSVFKKEQAEQAERAAKRKKTGKGFGDLRELATGGEDDFNILERMGSKSSREFAPDDISLEKLAALLRKSEKGKMKDNISKLLELNIHDTSEEELLQKLKNSTDPDTFRRLAQIIKKYGKDDIIRELRRLKS